MKAEHTPGPWGVAIGKRTSVVRLGVTGPAVALCNYDNGPQEKANARLIAAAPDLLAALQRANIALCGYLPAHRNDVTDAAIAAATAAIAKAVGNDG